MGIIPELDWKQYIVENFFSIWEKNTPVDLTDYAFLIQHHFDVQGIEVQILSELKECLEPEKMIRYHKFQLRTLMRTFIEALLNVSDDGKHITVKNIERAKSMVMDEERCIYK